MALPLSGQISMDDIRIELGVSTQSPFGLDEARSGTYATINPCSTYKPPSTGQISLSDWYGYNHTQSCGPTYDFYNADYYDCTYCVGGVVGTILVAFAAGSVVTLNRFYQPQGGPDGFAYRVTSTASSGVAYILTTSLGSTTTCALACSV